MKRINKEFLLLSVVFIGIILILFGKFFTKGLIPFPGDFMLAWYEPWKSDFTQNGKILIPHKPVADDVFRQLYPYKILTAEFLKQFQFPLWNPYNGIGMPFMATMHAGFLTPLMIFFIALPSDIAWSLYILFQIPFLGLCTYLYSRKIGLSIGASLLTVLVLLFSGIVIVRLIFGEYLYAFSSLPLILYLIESFLQKKSSKKIFFLPLVVFFLFLSGQPQVIFYVLLFSSLYVMFHFLNLRKSYRLTINEVLLLFLLVLLGIGLSSIQLIPTFELFTQANIDSISSQFIFKRFLLSPLHFISLFIPNYFGNQATYNYWGNYDYIETIFSIGLIPLFFLFASFLPSLKYFSLRIFFLIIIFLSILLTINFFMARFLYSLPIPIISTGIPTRIFLLSTFSVAILSGFGFDAWEKSLLSYRKNRIGIFLFILIIFSILVFTLYEYLTKASCSNPIIYTCRAIALRNTLFEIGFFAVAFIIFLVSKRQIRLSALSIIILLIILGSYNSNKFLPFSAKESVFPQNELITEMKKISTISQARIFGIGGANIKTDFATYFKFYDPNYYDPLYNKRYGELVSYANTGKVIEVLPRSDVEIVSDINLPKEKIFRRNRLLDILGVKYLIYQKSQLGEDKDIENIIWQNDKWYLLENKNSQPRAYLVNKFEVLSSSRDILHKLFDPSFDPSKTALLEKFPLGYHNINQHKNFSNQTHIEKYSENAVIIKTNTANDSLLVLSDNYYPGWNAYIDGDKTNIYRANYTLRSILLPSGKHQVAFLYQPFSLQLGIFIALFSGFLYILLILIFRLKK